MNTPKSSPKVISHSWGEVEVEGFGQFKDVKLFPGGARRWDWKETGTNHQMADAEELLTHGAQEIILTQGVVGSLKVPAETIAALEAMGVVVHVARTPKAIELYNQLREDKPVGALIHSTC
jgi:hypothetical protein